jgi:hypothetical protein
MNDSPTNEEHDYNHGQEEDRDQEQEQSQQSPSAQTDHRTRRAREEQMDVSLAQKGGIYEVRSASDNTYEVDISMGTCSCLDWQKREPDGGCKHIRRVDMEIEAGDVPRPDGRLPQSTATTEAESPGRATSTEASSSATPPPIATDGGLHQNTDGDERFRTCMNRIADRTRTLEAEIDQRRAELKDLECTLSVIEDFLPEDHANADVSVNDTDTAHETSVVTNQEHPQPAD